MKYVKMLGLAAIAATALMAFVASSASATTLYSGTTKLPKGTEIVASLAKGGTYTLTATNGESLDTCTAGTVSGKTNQESATEITGEAAVSWGESGTECAKTTDTLKGGTIGITWIKGTINGTVKSYGAEVTVGGIFGVSCVYGTEATGTDLGELKGVTGEKEDATLAINTPVLLKSGGFLCPPSAIWKANYVVTSPTPLHVTE